METPNEKLKITIQKNEYEISFPNNGQLIDIETKKQSLSSGMMDSLLLGKTTSSNMAWMTISMIATFSILIPDLIKSLRVDSLLELTPIQSKEMVKVYMSEFLVWYHEWEDVINKDLDQEEKSPTFEKDDDIEEIS